MKEVSNTTIVVLLIIGIIVSFGGAMLNLDRLIRIGVITGYATASTLNVTISQYKAISVTGDIDFGSGYVSGGNVGAWLDSGDTDTVNGTWDWGSATYFIIENQGNSNFAVWTNASQDPADWIGTNGLAFINGTEPGSDNGCAGNTLGDMGSGFWALNKTESAQLCTDLDETDSADLVWAHARIYVPGDVPGTGVEKSTNVTFLGE